MDGLQQALSEIRRIGVEALKEIPEVLQELQLSAVPGTMADSSSRKAHVFLFSFARAADLAIQVKYEGRSRSLLKLLDPYPGDSLVRTLRAIVTDTFTETHNEDQCEEILRRIRDRVWDTLPAFNELLEEIEIEPIADRLIQNESEDEGSSAETDSTTQ